MTSDASTDCLEYAHLLIEGDTQWCRWVFVVKAVGESPVVGDAAHFNPRLFDRSASTPRRKLAYFHHRVGGHDIWKTEKEIRADSKGYLE